MTRVDNEQVIYAVIAFKPSTTSVRILAEYVAGTRNHANVFPDLATSGNCLGFVAKAYALGPSIRTHADIVT